MPAGKIRQKISGAALWKLRRIFVFYLFYLKRGSTVLYRTLIFGGTSEGRELWEFCSGKGIPAVLSVATDYGGELAQPSGGEVHVGRMGSEEMQRFFQKENIAQVIDATHPHAVEVTENIRKACRAAGLPCLRLLREEGDPPDGSGIIRCRDAAEAARLLEGMSGQVLLTTGSKELKLFAGISGFVERVYARVLPLEDSIRACREAGLPPARILAEQGPFSKDWNLLVLKEKQIRVLVTKDSGLRGGFQEKIGAARELGIPVLVIRRPPEEGISMAEIKEILAEGGHS